MHGWVPCFGSLYNGQASDLSSYDDDAVPKDCSLRDGVSRANTTGWLLSPAVTSTGAIVGMSGSGQNALSLPIGSIDWSLTTFVNAAASTGHVAYQHTCYPAHQVKVANTTLYLYTPPSSDPLYIARCLTGLLPEVIGSTPTKQIH